MRRLTEKHLERYLQHLRHLAFVRTARVRLRTTDPPAEGADGVLSIQSPRSTHLFDLEVKRAHVTYAVVDAVIGRHKASRAGKETKPLMLFAPHIGRPLAEYLVAKEVNFVDEAGNCHVRLGNAFMALIEGRTATYRAAAGRGIGMPGHLVLFAILAKPELINGPIRKLAGSAGVSKTAVEHILARLTHEGILVRARERRHLQDKKLLLDRWLSGYSSLVRPRLLVGQYRTPDADPSRLEERIEQALAKDKTWGWGGGAAAQRLVGFYRGSRTVLHLADPSEEIIRSLKALPSKEGELILLRTPGRITFEGAVPRTVHPLLVYTELLTEGTDRARESAEMIRDRYLQWL
jgi:hypothetical protein